MLAKYNPYSERQKTIQPTQQEQNNQHTHKTHGQNTNMCLWETLHHIAKNERSQLRIIYNTGTCRIPDQNKNRQYGKRAANK